MRKGQNRGALLVLCLCVCYIMHEKNEDESEILNDSWHKLGNFVFFFILGMLFALRTNTT
jgi:VanZ family protein